MNVEVNGKLIELAEGASVHDAAAALGIEEAGRGVAIALDGEVIPRGSLAETPLREGQRVEVVSAIGGGAR